MTLLALPGSTSTSQVTVGRWLCNSDQFWPELVERQSPPHSVAAYMVVPPGATAMPLTRPPEAALALVASSDEEVGLISVMVQVVWARAAAPIAASEHAKTAR